MNSIATSNNSTSSLAARDVQQVGTAQFMFVSLIVWLAYPLIVMAQEPKSRSAHAIQRRWESKDGKTFEGELRRLDGSVDFESGKPVYRLKVIFWDPIKKTETQPVDLDKLSVKDQEFIKKTLAVDENVTHQGPLRASFSLRVSEQVPDFVFLLIPAGEFHLGYSDGQVQRLTRSGGSDPLATRDCRPELMVRVEEAYFVLDREVTKAQFSCWRSEQRSDENGAPVSSMDEPKGGVTWKEAGEFCNWLDNFAPAGYTIRLPTEIEWEYAARGPTGRVVVWQDGDPDKERPKFLAIAKPRAVPADCADRSWRDVFDLGGNLQEWCLDAYNGEFYSQLASSGSLVKYFPSQPLFGRPGRLDVVVEHSCRGGCWSDVAVVETPMRRRQLDSTRNEAIGIRPVLVLRSPPQPQDSP